MLSNIQKNIIVRALQIRGKNGENPAKAIKDYTKITDCERDEILKSILSSNKN